MFFTGPWHMGLIEEAGGKGFEGKWAVAPMPTKETNTSFVGGSDLAVFKRPKNRDAAWKFVEYLTKPETQAKWYEIVQRPAVQPGGLGQPRAGRGPER